MDHNNKKVIWLSKPQQAVFMARTALVLDMAGQGAGKTENIGVQSAEMIKAYPKAKGFIGANTYKQLSDATLLKAFATWEKYYGWVEYDKKNTPHGFYVVDKQPPPHFRRFTKVKSYNNTISFANGAIVFTGSLDNYKAHDGKEFLWAHLDETKDTRKEALTHVILGRLRQMGLYFDDAKQLHWIESKVEAEAKGYTAFNPCYIHTSPSYGGVDWLIELFNLDSGDKPKEIKETLADPYSFYYHETDRETVVIYQTYWNEDNLPDNYISNARKRFTDEEQSLFIEGYPFSRTGQEYYPSFSRQKHVVKQIPIDFKQRLHLTYDFNVMPYVTQLAVQIDNVIKFYNKDTGEKVDFLEDDHTGFVAINVMRFKVVKEFCMKPPENETEKAAEAAGTWYKANDGKADIRVYGDGSGHNRITGLASLTQYKIIKRILQKYFATEIAADRSNLSVLSRKKLMNRIFEGKYPEIEIYISRECVETIRDLEFLKQAPEGGKYKEKVKDEATGMLYEKIGHTSDALEYLICKVLKHYLKFID